MLYTIINSTDKDILITYSNKNTDTISSLNSISVSQSENITFSQGNIFLTLDLTKFSYYQPVITIVIDADNRLKYQGETKIKAINLGNVPTATFDLYNPAYDDNTSTPRLFVSFSPPYFVESVPNSVGQTLKLSQSKAPTGGVVDYNGNLGDYGPILASIGKTIGIIVLIVVGIILLAIGCAVAYIGYKIYKKKHSD